MSNYKYYVNNIEVFPKNGGNNVFTYQNDQEANVKFNVVLEKEFVFDYIQPGFNFKTQEEDNLCDELIFKITKKCNNTWALFWEGFFYIVDGTFDDDACLYSIKPNNRQFLFDDLEVNMFDEPTVVEFGGQRGVFFGSPPQQTNYNNVKYFDKVVLFIAQKANQKITGIISNFFQINPTVVSSDCLPGVPNYFKYMVFCSLSDAQFPIPSNPATKEIITFGELMDDLFILFRVYWFIDSNYNLRIEHETFFDGSAGIDLTSSNYSQYAKSKNNFKFDLSEYPKKETLKIYQHAESSSLTYYGISNIKSKPQEKILSTKKIATYLFQNTNSDGVLLLAHDNGVGSGIYRIDDYITRLSPSFLQTNIHTYNKPSLYAIHESRSKEFLISSGGIVLKSKKPTIIQEDISFPLCCDGFDITKTMKTELGDGKVYKASLDQKTEMLTVGLKHFADNCEFIDPSDISGLDLWLKRGTGITYHPTTLRVSQWNDYSGNNRHAVQANTALQPLLPFPSPTSNVGVRFEGNLITPPTSEEYLVTPAFQLFPNKRGTIITVISSASAGVSAAAGMSVLSTNTTIASIDFDLSLKVDPSLSIYNPIVYFNINENKRYPTNIRNTYLNYQFKGLEILRRSSDTNIYVDEKCVPAKNNPLSVNNSIPQNTGLVIGFNRHVNGGLLIGNVSIVEVMVYSRDLTDIELEQIKFYFIKKGMLTVS